MPKNYTDPVLGYIERPTVLFAKKASWEGLYDLKNYNRIKFQLDGNLNHIDESVYGKFFEIEKRFPQILKNLEPYFTNWGYDISDTNPALSVIRIESKSDGSISAIDLFFQYRYQKDGQDVADFLYLKSNDALEITDRSWNRDIGLPPIDVEDIEP